MTNQKHSNLTKKLIQSSLVSATLVAGVFFTNTNQHAVNAAETTTSSTATQTNTTDKVYTITPTGYYIGNTKYAYGTNGIDLPDSIKQSDFYRTYTRTIRYIDSDSNTEVAKTVTQSVELVRWGTYDFTTNKIVDWGNYSASKDGNPVSDSLQFNKQDSPDLSSKGLELTGESTVAALPVTPSNVSADSSNDPVVTVYYKHKTRAVNSTDNAVTQKVTTRQINLVNSSGSVIGQTTQKVTFTRNALYFDEYTKKIVYSDWEANVGTSSDWSSYTVPDSVNFDNKVYSDPDLTSIAKEVVNATTSDSTITVTYQKSASDSNSGSGSSGSSNNTDNNDNESSNSSNSNANTSGTSSSSNATNSQSSGTTTKSTKSSSTLPSTAKNAKTANYSSILLALAASAVLTVAFFNRSTK